MSARRWMALVCGIVLACTMLGTASASELALTAPARASTATVERCATAPVLVSGEGGSATVTLSEVPAACRALPLRIAVHDAGRTYRADVVAPPSGGDVTVTLTGLQLSTASSALVTAASWPLATTTSVRDLPFLSCRTPDNPAAGCQVRVRRAANDEWPSPVTMWTRWIEVTTTSRTPVRWELVINLSHPSVPTHPTRSLHDTTNGGMVRVATSGCDAEPRTVTVQGNRSWLWHTVVAGGEVYPLQLQGSLHDNQWGSNLLRCR